MLLLGEVQARGEVAWAPRLSPEEWPLSQQGVCAVFFLKPAWWYSARGTGSIPGLGRFHMPQSNRGRCSSTHTGEPACCNS